MQNNNDDDDDDSIRSSSSDGSREENDLGYNTGVAALMEVVEANKLSNLCKDKYSPLEMVLMMRSDLDTVKRIYEMYPPALNGKLLVNVCCHGAQPGVVGFLASKLPGAIRNPDEEDVVPLELAMGHEQPGPGRPTERDLRTMIDLYPRGLCYGNWQTYLSVLCYQYSPEFTDYVFRHMANLGMPDNELYFCYDDVTGGSERRLEFRNQIDLDCVKAMAHVIPNITTVDIDDMPWHVDALVKFLQIVSKNSNVKQLHLHSPCERNFDVDDLDLLERSVGQDRNELLPQVKKSLVDAATKSGFESLVFSFNDDDDPFCSFLLGDFASKIPTLQRLRFFADHNLELITPALIQLLNTTTTLQQLEFTVYPIESKIDGDLTALIDAIANNKVLKSFKYTEDDCDSSQDEAIWFQRVGTWKDYAAKALENNITIEEFEILPLCNTEANNTIAYYTKLNQYGRAMARKSDTTPNQLVSLLSEIDHDDPVRFYYGLLRESPGCWSLSAISVPSTTKNNKRMGTVISKGGRRSSARLAKRQRK